MRQLICVRIVISIMILSVSDPEQSCDCEFSDLLQNVTIVSFSDLVHSRDCVFNYSLQYHSYNVFQPV